MSKPIDIFITAFLRPQMTEQTFKYLKERTNTPHRFFMIHNGGNEEFLIEHGHEFFLIIDPGTNMGIHAAWNIALALAESDYFITTDNDILVPDSDPDWLYQLIKMMDERPDYGAIALQPHKFIGLDKTKHPDDGKIFSAPMTGAVMRLMRREAVWKAGGWERVVRSSRNHEEKTICSRLATNGYKFGYASDLYAFHMFGDDDTDYWGYPKEMKPEDHGHRDIWPPPTIYGDKSKYDGKTWKKL